MEELRAALPVSHQSQPTIWRAIQHHWLHQIIGSQTGNISPTFCIKSSDHITHVLCSVLHSSRLLPNDYGIVHDTHKKAIPWAWLSGLARHSVLASRMAWKVAAQDDRMKRTIEIVMVVLINPQETAWLRLRHPTQVLVKSGVTSGKPNYIIVDIVLFPFLDSSC